MITWKETVGILEETIRQWIEGMLRHLPNAVVSLCIVIIFWVLANILKRVFEKVFRSTFDSEVILRLASTIAKITVLCLGVFVALGVLGLQKAALSMLAGAGIIGIALGFAFQDAAENLIAGIVMGIRKPFRKGDLIETHDRLGFVEKLNLRNTILENFDGQRVIIPNKEVFQNTLINYQVTGKRRVEFEVGVSYESVLEEVIRVAKEAIESNLEFIVDNKAEILAYGFGDSSITLKIRYWVKVPGDVAYITARHLGVKAIHKAFNEAGIVIPFPIRTIDMGGQGRNVIEGLANKQKSEEESDRKG